MSENNDRTVTIVKKSPLTKFIWAAVTATIIILSLFWVSENVPKELRLLIITVVGGLYYWFYLRTTPPINARFILEIAKREMYQLGYARLYDSDITTTVIEQITPTQWYVYFQSTAITVRVDVEKECITEIRPGTLTHTKNQDFRNKTKEALAKMSVEKVKDLDTLGGLVDNHL